jgi:protein farnesyltransferase subunit beta
MIYWIVHGLCVLGDEATVFYDRVIDTLRHMQNRTGGFGGGPMQLSHG